MILTEWFLRSELEGSTDGQTGAIPISGDQDQVGKILYQKKYQNSLYDNVFQVNLKLRMLNLTP